MIRLGKRVTPRHQTPQEELLHFFEYKFDIKGSGGNMFKPISQKQVPGHKHAGRRAVVKPKLSTIRGPVSVVQMNGPVCNINWTIVGLFKSDY